MEPVCAWIERNQQRVELTGAAGEEIPAALAMANNVVHEEVVLLQRPGASPELHHLLLMLAARHCSHGPFPLRHYCGLPPCCTFLSVRW